jgi:hypothetical protein
VQANLEGLHSLFTPTFFCFVMILFQEHFYVRFSYLRCAQTRTRSFYCLLRHAVVGHVACITERLMELKWELKLLKLRSWNIFFNHIKPKLRKSTSGAAYLCILWLPWSLLFGLLYIGLSCCLFIYVFILFSSEKWYEDEGKRGSK